jgi:hypothetical protein
MRIVDHNSRFFEGDFNPARPASSAAMICEETISALDNPNSDRPPPEPPPRRKLHVHFADPISDSVDDSPLVLALIAKLDSGAIPDGEEGPSFLAPIEDGTFSPDEALSQCHNARVGHHGVRRTWNALNKYFPGHRIPYRRVTDFVSECPICQKDRLGMGDALVPLVRHLKVPTTRSRIGIDTLTVTPVDIHGNQYLTVIVNQFTKLVAGYPSKEHNAQATCAALYQYFATYGLVDEIITDPGIEFKNEIIEQLTQWFGITHIFSLVDRHESNGVERTNQEILRHLKALVLDERVKKMWSDPTVLPSIFLIINSAVSNETGVVPFHATFGNQNSTYFKVPDGIGDSERTKAYMKLVSDNLVLIADLSKRYQNDIVEERTKFSIPELQNQYQPGDYVLFQMNPDEFLPHKLYPKFRGPYEVIKQVKNDVEVRNLIYGSISKFHVERLKIFHASGSPDEVRKKAFEIAQRDNDQYVISRFLAFRGDIESRKTMEFEIEYVDRSVKWLPWSVDIFETMQYEEFCDKISMLFLLKYKVDTARQIASHINKTPITCVNVGDEVYVNLRQYGCTWYEGPRLPDFEHVDYVLLFKYVLGSSSDEEKNMDQM